ncbi:hypothetical protein N7455_006965 [Penicillium solitum]|uniref:uncharacterized protein n=1 Tax=Penicillium solitum TaxID=60172 RepID=UPI001803E597|nr:hypothetical protein HAV15_009437 [Penicillium sp. str. \
MYMFQLRIQNFQISPNTGDENLPPIRQPLFTAFPVVDSQVIQGLGKSGAFWAIIAPPGQLGTRVHTRGLGPPALESSAMNWR